MWDSSIDLSSLIPSRFMGRGSASAADGGGIGIGGMDEESSSPFLLLSERSGSNVSTPTAQESNNNNNDDSFFPALTWKERLIGCGSCMVLGYLLSFGSFFRVKDLLLGHPLPFVLNATFGNMIALVGSCFLTGPKVQWSRMNHKSRRHASLAYMTSLIMTLIVALAIPVFPGKAWVLLLLMLIQYVAVFWYCISYIPFAREAIQGYLYRMVETSEM